MLLTICTKVILGGVTGSLRNDLATCGTLQSTLVAPLDRAEDRVDASITGLGHRSKVVPLVGTAGVELVKHCVGERNGHVRDVQKDITEGRDDKVVIIGAETLLAIAFLTLMVLGY